jgi:rhamnose utilization protein RhaD (predicted bifunctional aldolase and dehydrogenase)
MNASDLMLDPLVRLSHELGREDRQLAILGEGNTSVALGDGTFWVKASGSSLGTITPADFTRVKSAPILAALDQKELADDAIRAVLQESQTDPQAALPSVETFLHALCLEEAGARWVGHTHPVSVLQILCSQQGAEPFLQHIFPDAVVVCGRHLAVVPYLDPGLPLALAVRATLRAFQEQHGRAPKVILMVNHGPVVLGQTEREVLNLMLMLDKWARILLGTSALGGPRFITVAQADRIDRRPDEHHRQKRLAH